MVAATLALAMRLHVAAQEPASTAPPTHREAVSGEPETAATNHAIASTNAATIAPTNKAPTVNSASANPGAMQIRAGFHLQIVATDPFVINPVALAFDAAGRLFVAEQAVENGPGRIKLLEDADGDGYFDEARIFADNLPSPTALICYGGGLFVASGTQIVFLPDENRDGIADLTREIFGGFETNNANGVAGGGINNFTWGLDNRIHAASAGVGGDIACLAIPTGQRLAVTGHDFAFDPRTLEMILEPGGNSRGVTFDSAGRRFLCTATRPAQFSVCDPDRASQNPLYIWPQLLADLTPADLRVSLQPAMLSAANTNSLPANGVYLSRARLATNQFAKASSLHVYRGGAMSRELANNVFITDPMLRTVSRWQLRENGTVPVLERPNAERNSEFLSSRDPTFRPVQIANGPDGTLYIADLARENLDQPGDRGRIWRVLPRTAVSARAPDLTTLNSARLIELLGSPNSWARSTASRLLFERADTNSIALVTKEFRWSWNPLAKLHMLHLLDALGALNEETLLRALRDKDEGVRENAAKLAARSIRNGGMPNAILAQLAVTANDVSARVRFQAALTLAGVNHPAVPRMLANAVRRSPADPWLQSAVLTGANSGAAAVLINLVSDSRMGGSAAGWDFLRELALLTGQQTTAGMDEVLRAIEQSRLSALDQLTLARTVGEGLHLAGRTFVGTTPDNTWRAFGSRALDIALGNNSANVRAEAIRYVGVSGYTSREVSDWVLALLRPREPQVVQSATIDALARFQDPYISSAFIQRWPSLPATSQREIISKLLGQFDRTMALLSALENNQIPRTALTDVQVNFLRTHRDTNTAARAVRLYGPMSSGNLAAQFATALQIKGSVRNGRELFLQRCADCHQFKEEGRAFGPSLDSVANRDREQLLTDILEPNREVSPEYQTQVIHRTDNELSFGLVSESGPDVLVLKQPGGRRIFMPRTQVDDTFKQEWSLMPANATAGLSVTDLADLLAYIASGQ